ncbi:hypothetical protein PVAP13_9KG308757 [Panicum virgatum]|uniref:Uncharacterized protein n=1 Tax=Panicum virgatum TaxID=38727 RepID=A0A8T0NNH4_PANVG|nr:hypothetical protein PVAP13_9KG308757 [Panicum virgatum]
MLLQVTRQVAETYASIGRRYSLYASRGVTTPEKGIMEGFKRAFSVPWLKTLREIGGHSGEFVVAEATNCTDDAYVSKKCISIYAHGDAWCLPVGADTTLPELKDAGVKLAVLSNFDTRLRKLLKDLNVFDMFDAIVVPSEVGYEKPAPAPEIFKIALVRWRRR